MTTAYKETTVQWMIDAEYISSVTRLDNQVITVGTFDGVHIGHKSLLDSMAEQATGDAIKTVVTFEPHPREVVSGTTIALLTSPEDKVSLLRAAGADRVVIIPFDKSMVGLEPISFVVDILHGKIGFNNIVLGYDHSFGRGAEGGEDLLRDLGRQMGFAVTAVEATVVDGAPVSSSRIRTLLTEDGAVAEAGNMLGRRYHRYGDVIPGDGRGRTIGFPTANLSQPHASVLVPRTGVYAVLVQIDEGSKKSPPHSAMMNIGVRPTFGGSTVHEEVHLLDWSGDLYGKQLRIEFVERLRDERKFESVEALVKQLEADKMRCSDVVNAVS